MGLTDTGWLKAAKTTSLRRQIHCDVICHTTARRRSWQLSPHSEIGPSDPTLPGHSWNQFLVGTIPRSIRICVPNLVMIGPAVWPPILDRQTHTHTEFVLYRYRFHCVQSSLGCGGVTEKIVQCKTRYMASIELDKGNIIWFWWNEIMNGTPIAKTRKIKEKKCGSLPNSLQ